MQRVPRIVPVALSLFLLAATAKQMLQDGSAVSHISRQLRAVIDREKVCNTLPTLHDMDPSKIVDYDKVMTDFLRSVNGYNYDFPEDFASIPRQVDGSWVDDKEPGNDGDPRFFTFSDSAKYLMLDDEFEGFPRAVAWKGEASVPAETTLRHHNKLWKEPTEADEARTVDRTVVGDHIAYVSWFTGNFGHFLHDHLPIIAWLIENVDPEVKFLLLDHPKHREILNIVDANFVENRVVWVQRNELLQVTGTLTVAATSLPYRNLRPIESLGRWLHRSMPQHHQPTPTERTILYYTRGGSSDTEHGRVVEPQHEADILETIRRGMKKYNRPEKLVVFNGQDSDGHTMSVAKQFELYRSATAVIGPHGSGLANIVWMDPSGTPPTSDTQAEASACAHKPKILEFLLGPDSTQVHPPCSTCEGIPFTRTYYILYSGIPWMDYHHLLYAPNSTEATTYIDLRALESGLDDLWEGDELPPVNVPTIDTAPSTPSQEGDASLEVFLHLSDVSTPIDPSDTPVFFHIPRAGTSMKWILGGCLGLTMATDAGIRDGHDQDKELQVITAPDGAKLVNVDTTTVEGLERAAQMGFAQSQLADVVVTPHFYPASMTLFDSDHKARLFTMLRHPIHRALSMYNYLKTADWEPTHDPRMAYMGVEEYAKSEHVENNWIIRFLTGEMDGTINESHLNIAKQMLSDYCLVGLMDEKEESMKRFEAYFGLEFTSPESQTCRDDLLSSDVANAKRNAEDVVKESFNPAWQLLRDQNLFDIELYEYALEVFKNQAKLFEKGGVHHK